MRECLTKGEVEDIMQHYHDGLLLEDIASASGLLKATVESVVRAFTNDPASISIEPEDQMSLEDK